MEATSEWPKTTLTSIYMAVLLVLFVMKQDFPLFLIWLHTPIYFLHAFEEYILPGGFLKFFNAKALGSKDPEIRRDVLPASLQPWTDCQRIGEHPSRPYSRQCISCRTI